MTILGVVGDTHIPDRARRLNPHVLEVFQQAKVNAIMHAGDVSIPGVLEELSQVAPVYAVQGNRDIISLRHLPMSIQLDIEGISIGMAHGHGTFSRYMLDKFQRAIHGRSVELYLDRMLRTFPNADVIVFGHLHVPCNLHLQDKLMFNPGSASYPWPRGDPATVGLLHLSQGREPQGEIITLG